MKKIMQSITLQALVLGLLVSWPTGNAGSEPHRDLFSKVQGAVYEVIIPKPGSGDVTYEKDLPLHLIPYSIRVDKYYSIGSAFAIEGGVFVSAAHVFSLDEVSRYVDRIYLRDRKGKVYEVDKVLAYSSNRDFLMFTVKKFRPISVLKIHPDPGNALNQEIYAAGNALGEGIVMRNGLLTSMTPEEELGEWKWLRFSAAASPGNSGGPLVDNQGRVLGIILRKSENENLNYALPIDQAMTFSRKKGVIHDRFTYSFPLLKNSEHVMFHSEVSLPADYRKLRAAFYREQLRFSRKVFAGMLEKQKARLFPRAPRSLAIMHRSINAFFPALIAENDAGVTWFKPEEIQKVELGNNGIMYYGQMDQFVFMNYEKPDEISLARLASDPVYFGDAILTGLRLDRTVGTEKVRITSMGNAVREETIKDIYGRTWILRVYGIPWSFSEFVTCTMVMPSGFVSIMRVADSGMESETMQDDLKKMVNFVLVSMRGTVKEWQDYMKLGRYQPNLFRKVTMDFRKGSLNYRSPELSFSTHKGLVNLDDRSVIHINFGLMPQNPGKQEPVTWSPSQVFVLENEHIQNGVWITREYRPEQGSDLNDSFHVYWKKVSSRLYPFDGSVRFQDGKTVSQKVHDYYNRFRASSMPWVVYLTGVRREGKREPAYMKKLMKKWTSVIKLNKP